MIERKFVSIMLDPLADTDDGVYLKKNTIDRSVGYLIAGVVVLMFFLLTVLGMGRIQHLNDETGHSNRYVPEEKAPEIGDTEVVGVKD